MSKGMAHESIRLLVVVVVVVVECSFFSLEFLLFSKVIELL
jgi:hypothetical protein